MILSMLSGGNGCLRLKDLLRDCHESKNEI